MPIYRDEIQQDDTRIIIWAIEEAYDFFREGLILGHPELNFIDGLNNKRKLEWVASRYLIQEVLGMDLRVKLKKDIYGKPYLDQEKVHISISHSHQYSALAVSPKVIGIDIQKELHKISRIAHKFIGKKEENFIPKSDSLAYQHVIWGAKESMYKAYGRKKIDFIKEMQVSAFDFKQESSSFGGSLTKDKKYNYDIKAEKIEDFYFVCAKERI